MKKAGVNQKDIALLAEELRKQSYQEIALRLLLTELERDRWREIARRDYLTGVYNELGLIEIFEAKTSILEKGQVTDERRREVFDRDDKEFFVGFSIVIFDLVGLHATNANTLEGRAEGDRKLKICAAVAAEYSRSKTDTVARVGGDEFAIVLINGNDQSVEELGKRVIMDASEQDVLLNVWGASFSPEIGIQEALNYARKMADIAKNEGPKDTNGRSVGRTPVYIAKPISGKELLDNNEDG